MLGFPSHFGGSPTSYPDPLVILRLSGIVPRSPSHSGGSSASCPNPLFSGIVSDFILYFPAPCPNFLCFLWHRTWILYLSRKCVRCSLIFSGTVPGFPLFSSALRLDLISLPETRQVFSYLFWHHVQIPLAFSGSVPWSFSPSIIMVHSLSLFMVVWGQNYWSFEFFTRVHFTHSLLALCIRDSLVHSLYCPLTLAFYLWVSHAPMFSYDPAMTRFWP